MVNKQTVLLGAGAAVVAVVVLSVVLANGKKVGRAVGEGAGDLAVGAVLGLGDALGLPDPTEPAVRDEGAQALADGDYLSASQKLPALDFLGGIGSKLGLWFYDVTHGDEDPTQ